MSKVDQENKV